MHWRIVDAVPNQKPGVAALTVEYRWDAQDVDPYVTLQVDVPAPCTVETTTVACETEARNLIDAEAKRVAVLDCAHHIGQEGEVT